ncbi:hypothetical protein [Vibrio vulnificus]|uniref:hypothetical protein n=1 Tax=Vibrio vulnificus TaxID=672 RepID=UPI001A2F8672|nr:hypothetical protein [Vibrio vulnificus]EHK9078627.1 hypothetical protein [Vibrio parahaemolyticus]EGQ9330238.1 DUF2513 domain-containing protein [Vibrio vulnificus]EHZ7360180.1 hypothetical protein [Vibrio vulnificus]MBY7715280.1 hypothetical protein [Vibrio vulnificus]MBY7724581.1 hypothetical protein [Vibrio vulnificus]
MEINHDCIKNIIAIYINSEKAELSIQAVVESESMALYSTEELKFHFNRLIDRGWLISNYTRKPYEIYQDDTPSWSVFDWRLTESANQYWDSVNRLPVWQEFKNKTASESLDFSLELLKGYSKKWIEKKLSEFEI